MQPAVKLLKYPGRNTTFISPKRALLSEENWPSPAILVRAQSMRAHSTIFLRTRTSNGHAPTYIHTGIDRPFTFDGPLPVKRVKSCSVDFITHVVKYLIIRCACTLSFFKLVDLEKEMQREHSY